MASWGHLLPKLHVQPSEEPGSWEPVEDERALMVPRASNVPFNDRLSISPSPSTINEDVFHSAQASPIAHRNSVSSNRIPSPMGRDKSPQRPCRPFVNTAVASMWDDSKKKESIPSTGITASHSSDEECGPKHRSGPLSAFARLENPRGPSAVVFGTNTISRRYLPRPKVEEETPWEQALDFDLADLHLDTPLVLAPVIARHLDEAAKQYQTGPPRAGIHDASEEEPATRVEFPEARPPSFRYSQNRGEHSSNADDDVGTGTEDDEAEFCCPGSRRAPIDHPDLAHCYGCKMTYCSECWRKQPLHKKKNKAGHRKVDAGIARMIQETLEVGLNEAEQAQLHLLDESASWFGAMREGDQVFFRDFGRYASMMTELTLEERKRTYPALVSFVGETGAGKSSLVKLLVGLKKSKTQDLKLPTQTPVVGNNSAITPTSGDVHLYADPQTFFGERPLLYADCEGLHGGTMDPVGAKRRRRLSTGDQTRNRTVSFDKYVRRRHETAEREIAWATTPEKKMRSYFVENLYPRLLYTFSDVIVFVVKNARVIEDVVLQLVVWADAVIETASNQPVLPHAIIVLNAYKTNDAKLWGVDNSTQDLLERIRRAVNKNPRLSELAQKWISKGFAIDSVESLLLAYYSSVRVVRIPGETNPSQIHEQIQRLYEEITNSAAGAHDEKHRKRVKLNAEALQPYLQQAFDHFCRDLNDPFDFIKASFADAGIPSDFSGNITKLAVNVMKRWENKIDGALLFRELSFIIASCVMLDAIRNGKLGLAGPVFKQYIDHFDETLDDFCEKVWPCEYVSAKGRCVNVKAGHAKGHQLSHGQILAAGEYQSDFTAESHRQHFRNDIFSTLSELLSSLTDHDRALREGEHEAAAKLHESKILDPFYRHLGGARNYVSHSACLCCLVSPAQHCLPCGHVICTQCVRDFGHSRGQNSFEMKFCPLHKSETADLRQTISLKPENAGVRVLCLDGGGVRGIIMLETLLRLERDLGGNLRIASFFDLILGTSTGGIIALGLGKMGWSLRLCHKKFQKLASSAFCKHKLLGAEFVEWLVAGFQHGRYKIGPLEDLLRTEYSEERLFGGVNEDPAYPSPSALACKVGVITTTTNGTPYLLSNYNREDVDETAPYGFLRPEKPEQEIKIWEAARGTSAAPKIFKPYGHAESGYTFVDGGVYYNNPIEIALREPGLIWPLSRPRLPDIVLSLGTGYGPSKTKTDKESTLPMTPGKGPVSYYRQLLKIAVDHVKHSQKSEDEYHRIRKHYNNVAQASSCFMRFNMYFEQGIPKPDNVARMPELMSFAREQLDSRSAEIRHIANRMIASSFYFDPIADSTKKDAAGRISLQGYIRCRFQGAELRTFGDLLKQRCQEAFNVPNGPQHTPCFVLEDRSRPRDAEQVVLSDNLINGMIDQARFNFYKVTITVSHLHAESDIHLRFGAEPVSAPNNSISGFPRCWDDKKLTPMTARLNLSDLRTRFPSRRGRPSWVEPTTTNKPILGKYAEVSNPGLATDEQLRAVELRLSDQIVFQPRPDRHELEGSSSSPTSIRSNLGSDWHTADRKPPPYHSASLSPPQEAISYSVRSPVGTLSTDVFEIDSSFSIHELPGTTPHPIHDIDYSIRSHPMYPPSVAHNQKDNRQRGHWRDSTNGGDDEESDMYGPG